MVKDLLSGYLKECQSGGEAKLKTFFKCYEKGESLFFDFESQQDFPCPKHAEYNKPLYEGDTVEVFLTLDSPNRYLEIEVNQLGAEYCVIIENKDGEGDIIIKKLEKSLFTHKNEFGGDIWACQIKIDKKKLYQIGWSEDMALINAHRQDFDREGKLNIYSLFPTFSKTFHKSKAFQRLYRGGTR